MAIGRLPAASPEELGRIIDRIEARQRAAGAPWMNNILMLADNGDKAGNFPTDSDGIAAAIPSGFPILKVYLNGIAPSTARSMTIQKINEGTGFVNYIGHGALNTLASEGILRTQDISQLTSADRPTVLTAATCLVGYFSYPGFSALGELLIREGTGGAAAVWVASGMSQNQHAIVLNREFYEAALIDGQPRLGDAVLAALRAYHEQGRPSYLIDTYVLLGDPAMGLK
jgi:hypothetical protein